MLVFLTIWSNIDINRKKGGGFLKSKEYVLLKSLYYDRYEKYEELYKERFQSNECVHLNFKIENNPAFFMETPELFKRVVDITRLDKEISELVNTLPGIALEQYIKKCLIDEIVITNDIEGIHSTRKEIGEILNDLRGKGGRRFYGLVKKYTTLTSRDLSVENSRDIRALYDDMFLSEVVEEDSDNAPDGEIFRKGRVEVVDPTKKVIHRGLYPESKIVSSMDVATDILNDAQIEPLFRIAIFHYLFGYIHPFYTGNGLLNRYISSYYLANALEPIMGYRLSYTIKENINKYYKSSKIVNDEINRGDITPFIFTYLDFIKESAINLKAGLTEKSERLNVLKKGFLGNLPNGQEGKYTDLYYFLLQVSLFSEIGISTKSLIENLNVSRPTLQKRLHEIDENNLLVTEIEDRNKFYKLNLDTLVEKYAREQKSE